ncbi:coiled-coil domain-containing protein 169 isoform X2 [Malaclemys terrapin pileata]|uniref:coiled-coil domain-containing protein 169 isoform X2 n=1 Tax=Malaclemys terrapin pileata TaxID=2991368 RepID=UPI0023A814CC|nr:coiled-coil domain-containing protein 169 isoform X2 [Malaclemys terrapin pileata]
MGEGGDSSALSSEQLRLELGQEKQMKEMLELSVFELRNTITELEKRLSSVEDEGNEWKTRYETQVELNRQLERQTGLLQEKMEHICGNPTDRLSSITDRLSSIRSFDQMPVGSLNQLLKQLEEEKKSLQNQLKDYELRLEQEAKAYHKANDERRMYLAEISQTSATLKIAERQKTDAVQIKRKNQILRRHNVPENQRILDPKKGPIKKTAGVKQLPKLKH